MYCPKCGYLRTDRDDETIEEGICPSCGIVYAKYLHRLNDPPEMRIKQVSSPEKRSWIILMGEIFGMACFAIILVSFLIPDKKTNLQTEPAHLKNYAHKTTLKPIEQPEQVTQARDKGINCRQDLSCIASKLAIEKGYDCQKLIENKINYRYQWTNGAFESKFNRYAWKNASHDIVSIGGDSLQIQNVFGAFQNYIYVCDLTLDGFIVGANMGVGKLNK